MKHTTSIIKLFSLALFVLVGTACIDNFDKINQKDYQVDKEELGREGYNVGASLKGLQGLVIPTEEHLYQFVEALAAGAFSGYIGCTVEWTAKFETYNPPTDWQEAPFSDLITRTYPFYRDLLDETEDPVALALGKLLRVTIMHRVTDMYGPIPYSKIISKTGEVSLTVPYDSQEEVYKQMFKELDEVSDVLKENLNLSTEAFRKFDDVYQGDLSKWLKFTNSLKLRMAMRLTYVPEMKEEARRIAEEAVTAGVITQNADNAFLKVEENRAAMVFNNWNDQRVGGDIISYMNGYKDPRREKMFTTVKVTDQETWMEVDGYAGIRIGIDVRTKDEMIGAYSKPIITSTSPYMWMNAAEITFLRAEGALWGWYMGGEAKDLYNQAIALSFEQYGVTGADTYTANTTDMPQAYDDPQYEYTDYEGPRSTITIAWEEGDNYFERNLERIITQKWIANFPLGVEAWSEYRRTGYPHLLPVIKNKSGGSIDTDHMIRRLWYPPIEYSENLSNIKLATGMLGGPDNGGTRLWWDKKPYANP